MSDGDLKAVDGAAVGAWIEPGLGGEFGAVSRQVPKVFDAYARVFHRVTDDDDNYVTWSEVAKRLGRTSHGEMQWHQLVGSSDSANFSGSNWSGGRPELGEMEVEELDRLCEVLGRHTADPEHCYFGLCCIQSSKLEFLSDAQLDLPRLELPWGRDHVVLAGHLSAIDQLGWADELGEEKPDGSTIRVVGASTDAPADLQELEDRRWFEAPNLIWPADRSWLVVSEVDFDSTLVGGSRELIDSLVEYPDLEVYEVEPDTSLAAFSDKLNPVPDPEEG
jgi:hypothetical protein